jgi:hypothetical protein
MPPKVTPKKLQKGIKVRLPGFEFISLHTDIFTVLLLVITLTYWLAMCMIVFFQLKKENPLSWGYKQFFEYSKTRAPQK